MSAIGVSRPRLDAGPKVRGATRFAADLPFPGCSTAGWSSRVHAALREAGP
jgi:CO/xanthine dehydrogenase Mo-binding subunit